MGKSVMRAFLILLLGVVIIVGIKMALPHVQDWMQKSTSDATKTKGKITIAMDNWIGYFPLRSPEMKAAMRRNGWLLFTEDDKANYAQRMERLKNGEIDFAVATVDSFILNAEQFGFPGTIVMIIDESKGGDAILAVENKVPSLDALKGKKGIRVAFTPDSPSHHLAKAAADHFSVPELLPSGSLRIETNGSEEARDMLLSGKVDVAILWEPDVSKALSKKGIVKILGTEDTEKLIVDILIVNRGFASKNPDVVQQLIKEYFLVLKKYRDDPSLQFRDVKEETGLSQKEIESMLKGVKWVNFDENCRIWFGIAEAGSYANEGLVNTIDSTVSILVNSGDFSKNPLPNRDPYRLTNSSFLKDLFLAGFTTPGMTKSTAVVVNSIEARFPHLDEAGWSSLKEVATLKVEPIVFQSGASELDMLAKEVVDKCVERLKHYPNFRIVVKGHTGTRGDSEVNRELSQERADAVARYLEVVHNVDPNRMRVIGLGGTDPLPQKPGESQRTWQYRLSRVEIVLVRDVI